VATEDVVNMLFELNIKMEIDLSRLLDIANFISKKLQRQNLSRVGQAGITSMQQ